MATSTVYTEHTYTSTSHARFIAATDVFVERIYVCVEGGDEYYTHVSVLVSIADDYNEDSQPINQSVNRTVNGVYEAVSN